MSDNNKAIDALANSAAEVAKGLYKDAAHPILEPTGEIVSLIPRAIRVALMPLEKWVIQREYNLAETKNLLAEKLKNASPEQIESPEPHIAIPALQYISYCMDNDELRNMYANLLANSMNKVVKNGVHPGFVEIIKQLCPDEAKILKYLASKGTVPIINVRYELENGGGNDIIRQFSNVGELTGCESPFDANKYFDNLIRLGIVRQSEAFSSLTNKEMYKPLKEHQVIANYLNQEYVESLGYKRWLFVEGFISLTDYGIAFCNICLKDQ